MSEQQFREFIDDQLRAGEARFQQLQEELAANTDLTKANIAGTSELVEIFKAAKTGVSVFRWSGKNLRDLIKFLYPFALFGGAIAALLHGKWPEWPKWGE
ncbi:MAG: hypothetical protein ABI171_16165 [Collimonas sp.]|uniref:hypothetical protein n=1 Tax=Collimonas sp. TaxID=1963772 RepID=UPI0032654931